MLVLVVGPSGAGKDTLLAAARARLAADPRLRFVRREITRPADPTGENHVPRTPGEFAARHAAGAYALAGQAHGLAYGIPADIAADLAAGRIVVANVSRDVLEQAAARYAPIRVVVITALPAVLAARLAARGRESAADIAGRLARSRPIPAQIETITIVNDGSIADGAAALIAALTAPAAPDRPSGTAPPAPPR